MTVTTELEVWPTHHRSADRRPPVPYTGFSVSGEEYTLQLDPRASSPAGSAGSPPRDISILKSSASIRSRRAQGDLPAVTFNVENEEDSDDGQITFSVRPRPAARYRPKPPSEEHAPVPSPVPRSRPSSLLVSTDDAPETTHLSARSYSVEDSTTVCEQPVDIKLRGLRRTAEILRKVSSAERLSRFRDIISRGSGSRDRSPVRSETISDEESVPLVSPAEPLRLAQSPPSLPAPTSADLSPRSDVTEVESPRSVEVDFDLLPVYKSGGDRAPLPHVRLEHANSTASVSNMVEPYNMRLLAHGTSDGSRALWRQDAMDSGPPWPWNDPDSAV